MSVLILNIETSEKNCSVAIGSEGTLLGEKTISSEGFLHAEQLHLLIKEVMDETQVSFKQLRAVAVSEGPGSYTGLRIGVSAAKGIAYACEVPLIGVPTLLALYEGVEKKEGYDYWIPMIDARRMEVYCCVLDRSGEVKKEVCAEVLDENSFQELHGRVAVFGSGAQKSLAVLQGDFVLIDEAMNVAKNMVGISYMKFEAQAFADVAYFEPYYLKDFKAGMPKKMWK